LFCDTDLESRICIDDIYDLRDYIIAKIKDLIFPSRAHFLLRYTITDKGLEFIE